MLTLVENGAQPDQRRALAHRDAVVLARANRELVQVEALRELAEAPEVRARILGIVGFRRHRHQAAHLRVAGQEALEIGLRDAGLRLLAGEVDLDQGRNLQPRGSRLARKRVAELAELVHGLRLPALEVADEVPAEDVAVAGMLGLEVLRAVLADDLDPGLGEGTELVD